MNKRKHNRKLCTQKQLDYARKIADGLDLEISYNETSSYYEVSKFISNNVETFKKTVTVATDKQIDFANHIADVCGIDMFFEDNSNKETVGAFIDENISTYYKIKSDQTAIKYSDQINELLSNEETRHYLYDHLFKKHGIYAFIDRYERIVYIGKSVDLSERIPSSYNERSHYADIVKILYYELENMGDVNVLEVLLISENAPVLNTESNSHEVPTMFHSGIDILKDFTELPTCLGKIDNIDETELVGLTDNKLPCSISINPPTKKLRRLVFD